MNKGSLPQHHEMMWPLLESMRNLGGSANIREMVPHIATHMGLTDSQQSMMHTEFQTELEYRLAWARTYLKNIDVLANSRRGVWSITERGEHISKSEMEKELQMFRARMSDRRKKPPSDQDNEDLLLESDNNDDQWKSELLGILRNLSPSGFERLCQRLLREAGFVNVTVTGKSGDEGIDGVGLYRPSLISFPVFFQCKRYSGSVSSSFVRDFRGAMAGRGEKGLLITTSSFTKDAVSEAKRDGATPVELVDGADLCELLRQYDLGLEKQIKEIVTVNKSFFDEYL